MIFLAVIKSAGCCRPVCFKSSSNEANISNHILVDVAIIYSEIQNRENAKAEIRKSVSKQAEAFTTTFIPKGKATL